MSYLHVTVRDEHTIQDGLYVVHADEVTALACPGDEKFEHTYSHTTLMVDRA